MKKTGILLGIFLALFAFVYFYEYRGGLEREKAREQESLFLRINDDDVESITLVQEGRDTLAYVRSGPDGNTWYIVSPVATSAEESSIRANVRTFADARTKRRWSVKRESLADFGLDPPEAEVLIKKKDGTEKHLLVGKETATRGDIFVALMDGEGDEDSVDVLVTTNTVRVQATKSLFDLRDKKIAHFDDTRVNKVELNWNGTDIVLEKPGGKWSMAAPRDLPLDESRIRGFLRSLKNYSARTFVSEEWEDGKPYGFDRPSVRIRLTLGEEQSTKEIVVGKLDEKEEGYYAHESGRTPVFVIRESTRNTLTKDPFYFEEKKLVGTEKEEIREIRFSGAYRWTLVREDTLGWYAHGDTTLKVDPSRINRLHSNLRSLRVTDLVTYEPGDLANYGLRIPFLEVVLTGTKGEEEGFEIGDGFNDNRYVKRRDYPYVYSLPVSQVERITRWLEELAEAE
ncbi:MAG: DUF4340 domain-containing protein [Fidelibacterota bacterium]